MSRIVLTDLSRSRHRCCSGSPTPTENPLTRRQTLEEACLDDVLETFSKVRSPSGVRGLTFPTPPPSPGTMGEICFYARVSGPTGYPGLHLPYTARRPISFMDVDSSAYGECLFCGRSADWLRKHQSSGWKWESGFIPSFQHALIRWRYKAWLTVPLITRPSGAILDYFRVKCGD